MGNSCMTCPSRLDAAEAAKFFGKAAGGPMCARYGHVLGSSKMLPVAQNILADHYGSMCDSHGKKKPVAPPERLETMVAAPEATSLSVEIRDEDKQNVSNCRQCVFYVPDTDVAESLDWQAGMCARSGRLLLTSRLTKEAEQCEHPRLNDGSVPYNFPGLANIMLMPQYSEAVNYDPSPLGRWVRSRADGSFVDPRDYETDAEVTPDEVAQGIRAWRKIEDPHGTGNSVMVPVFDPDFFDDEERAKIPQTGDDEHPEDYIDGDNYVYSAMVEMMEMDETPALWGPAGVGKTELGRHLAWLMQLPFDRISITGSTEIEDVAGKMLFRNGQTEFHEGRLPKRWRKPGVLLLDEPNAGPPDVWQFIRPLTDNSKQLVLDQDAGQAVKRNDWCFFLMAMNPAWDYKNTGINELADADTNRLAHLAMELPDRDTEEVILRTRCEHDGFSPTKAQMRMVLDIAEEVRALVNDGSLPISWGVRPNIKVIRHLKWFDPLVAYRRAVADFLEPSARDMILNIVKNKAV